MMDDTNRKLIYADALKDALGKLKASGGHKYYRKGMDDTLHYFMPKIIDDAPTVDAVPVVRCKDCIRDNMATCPLCWIENHTMQFVNHDANFFCGFGERRNDDG